uniref:CutA1 divalent ion tolerance protein n=1 Tax=Cyanothece sp. (strain PCC 7425 / ATCC 29141) TaxID=395961 RepID=B8HYI2_CYAP4
MESITYAIVLVTVSSQAEAETIAHALIQSKLAAAVSFTPIQSIYTWQDQVHHQPEWQLLIKTRWEHYEAIATQVQALHSYEVPEIMAVPVMAGSPAYLQWIDEHTRATPSP